MINKGHDFRRITFVEAVNSEGAQFSSDLPAPEHALNKSLVKRDCEAFPASQSAERKSVSLPPFSHLALLRAEARTAPVAKAFLDAAVRWAATLDQSSGLTI